MDPEDCAGERAWSCILGVRLPSQRHMELWDPKYYVFTNDSVIPSELRAIIRRQISRFGPIRHIVLLTFGNIYSS